MKASTQATEEVALGEEASEIEKGRGRAWGRSGIKWKGKGEEAAEIEKERRCDWVRSVRNRKGKRMRLGKKRQK